MTPEKALDMILMELREAEKKFPYWPGDVVHAAAIVAEESGELTQAALDRYYERHDSDNRMIKEAAQTGAMAIRFLIMMEES